MRCADRLLSGPLRIYRVLEVSFLNSGTTLRPILAKSQCWCVDGESKFVLKIGYDSYYRIELPNTTAEQLQKVAEFKKVLARVLQFELTPCPFRRGFTVELPEKPTEPVRKRPWRPRQQSQPSTGQNPKLEHEVTEIKRNTAECTISQLEETNSTVFDDSDSAIEGSETTKATSLADGEIFDNGDGEIEDLNNRANHNIDYEPDKLDLLQTPKRPKSLKAARAITAPPQLTLRTTPPSNSSSEVVTAQTTRTQSPSLSSSMESFHSFHSPISPLPPSPPYSRPSSPLVDVCGDDTIHAHRTRNSKVDTLHPVTTTETARQWIVTSTLPDPATQAESSPPFPQTPTLISDTASQGEDSLSEAITPSPRTQLRHRRSSRRRAPSPLPAPANLYSPTTRLSGHHLTTAILQKTCSLLLGPPVQLVALMLNIARKIANGAYSGFSFGTGESGRKIPCSWDFSDTEDEEVWEEDDYGVSLGNIISSKTTKVRELGGSWEID